MTPEEAWSGRKPNVEHLRIFGCIAYAHIPDEKRKKLDDKGVKCIFLGYSDVSKAYKLFDPITEKIIISRDVIFDEANSWQWKVNAAGEFIPLEFDNEEGSLVNGDESSTPNTSPPSPSDHHHVTSSNLSSSSSSSQHRTSSSVQ